MVKAAVGGLGGDHQQRGGHGALRAVGGRVADDEVRRALADRGIGRRAAAVEIDSVNAALVEQELRQLIIAHAHRVRCLSAVGHNSDERAVGLERDAVPGVPVVVVGVGHNLAVADDEERSGDRLQNIRGIRAIVANGKRAVLQNRKIRLLNAAIAGLNNIALHDQVAQRLEGLHVIVVTVGREDDLLVGGFFIGLGLIGGLLHSPRQVLGSLGAGGGRAVLGVVALIGRLEGDLCIRCYRRHKRSDLIVAGGVVEQDVRLGNAVGNLIIRLRDQILAGRGRDLALLLIPRRKHGRNERGQHRQRQQQAENSLCHRMFHGVTSCFSLLYNGIILSR